MMHIALFNTIHELNLKVQLSRLLSAAAFTLLFWHNCSGTHPLGTTHHAVELVTKRLLLNFFEN